jgi:hypothetical protein
MWSSRGSHQIFYKIGIEVAIGNMQIYKSPSLFINFRWHFCELFLLATLFPERKDFKPTQKI